MPESSDYYNKAHNTLTKYLFDVKTEQYGDVTNAASALMNYFQSDQKNTFYLHYLSSIYNDARRLREFANIVPTTAEEYFVVGRSFYLLDDPQCRSFLEEASNRGFGPAMVYLAECYTVRSSMFSENPNHALVFELLEKAAEQGNLLANFKLGMMYWKGTAYVRKDLTVALRYFLEASSNSWPVAQVMYYRMERKISPDKGLFAVHYGAIGLIQAVDAGYIDAMYRYGLTYTEVDAFSQKNITIADDTLCRRVWSLVTAALNGHLKAQIEAAIGILVGGQSHRPFYINACPGRACKWQLPENKSELARLWLEEGAKRSDPKGTYWYGFVERGYPLSQNIWDLSRSDWRECFVSKGIDKSLELGYFQGLLNEYKMYLQFVPRDTYTGNFVTEQMLQYARRHPTMVPMMSVNHLFFGFDYTAWKSLVKLDGMNYLYVPRQYASDIDIITEALLQNSNAIRLVKPAKGIDLTQHAIPYMIIHRLYPKLTPDRFPKKSTDVAFNFSFQPFAKSKEEFICSICEYEMNEWWTKLVKHVEFYLELYPKDRFFTNVSLYAKFNETHEFGHLKEIYDQGIEDCDRWITLKLQQCKGEDISKLADVSDRAFPPIEMLFNPSLENLDEFAKMGYNDAVFRKAIALFEANDERCVPLFVQIDTCAAYCKLAFWYQNKQVERLTSSFSMLKSTGYYEKAAKMGNEECMLRLASICWFGDQWTIDDEKAMYWLERACCGENKRVQGEANTLRLRIDDKLQSTMLSVRQEFVKHYNRYFLVESDYTAGLEVVKCLLSGEACFADPSKGKRILLHLCEADYEPAVAYCIVSGHFPQIDVLPYIDQYLKICLRSWFKICDHLSIKYKPDELEEFFIARGVKESKFLYSWIESSIQLGKVSDRFLPEFLRKFPNVALTMTEIQYKEHELMIQSLHLPVDLSKFTKIVDLSEVTMDDGDFGKNFGFGAVDTQFVVNLAPKKEKKMKGQNRLGSRIENSLNHLITEFVPKNSEETSFKFDFDFNS
jgi:TPR repeat protein